MTLTATFCLTPNLPKGYHLAVATDTGEPYRIELNCTTQWKRGKGDFFFHPIEVLKKIINQIFESELQYFSWFAPEVELYWVCACVYVVSMCSGGADPLWRPRASAALSGGAAANGGAGGKHFARAPTLSQGRHKTACHRQALPDLQQACGHWRGGSLLHVNSRMINPLSGHVSICQFLCAFWIGSVKLNWGL